LIAVSAATLELTAALEESAVTEAMTALRSSGDAFAGLLDSVFDDLEILGREVESRAILLEEVRRQSNTNVDELQSVRHAEALAQAELVTVRREIEDARVQLSTLPARNNELKEHLQELERERCGLEAELEALRVRAAELADHLAEIKRETAEERAEWAAELKQLRRALERQTELLSDRLTITHSLEKNSPPATSIPTQATPANPATAPAAVSPPTSKDAVLGSVIAQFEMLQKDRQRRRGH
jgi:chromosome segregation ATPase